VIKKFNLICKPHLPMSPMSPGSAGPVPEEDPYNFIYDKLVISPNDINGMMAYSLYKREKVQLFVTL
jgi:hypothetical protein